jgi:predicted amidohydrolase YtcJ
LLPFAFSPAKSAPAYMKASRFIHSPGVLFSSLFLAIALLAACSSTTDRDSGSVIMTTQADLILANGTIYTMAGSVSAVEALAIGKGHILAVGHPTVVNAMAGPATQVIDLNGKVVFPGFHDLHVHPIFAGMQAGRCIIPQGSELSRIREIVQACAVRAEPGAWITGGQWDASAIGQVPDRSMIDDVTPDNPVLLGDTSEHSAWANTRAIELAGINADTPNPPGGIIERDARGIPTGILRETAIRLVRQHIPEPDEGQVKSALAWGIAEMLANGITAFTEASTGYSSSVLKELRAYAALADAGILKQRVRICLPWAPGNQALEHAIATRDAYRRDRVSTDCVKVFLDGVPTDSHTAAMLEPYQGTVAGRDDDASRYGFLLIDQDTINTAVARFDAMGLTVKFHTAGDAAVRAGLRGIEYARRINGDSGLRHNVGHCTFIAREDMALARRIGATFEMSPYLWSPSPINDDITTAVGMDRISRVWPVREAIASGALVVPGSDWSVVPSVNPWIAIEALVTRERPGGSSDSFGKSESISLQQAIELFTLNSAKQMGTADRHGRIEPGMPADLVIVDRDPYRIPVWDLHKVTVTHTIIDGELVFRRTTPE